MIPGHEAIGVVVEFGKNVKGFDVGDRCVADVGITVSMFAPTRTSLRTCSTGWCSAEIASIVAAGSPFCAKTSMRGALQWMVALLSTSHSKFVRIAMSSWSKLGVQQTTEALQDKESHR